MIWNDEDSGADQDVSVWGVNSGAEHLGGFFYINNNMWDPPGVPALCLRNGAFEDGSGHK